MALRVSFAAFDLAQLRAALGSRRAELIAPVVDHARTHGPALTDVDVVVQRAIHEGAPLRGLADEGVAHVAAADALAHVCGDAEPLSVPAFKALWLDRMIRLPPLYTQRFGWLAEGRPLLGTQFATNWSFYGYVARADVGRLVDSIASAATSAVFMADEDPSSGDEAMAAFARDAARAAELLTEAVDLRDDEAMERWLLRLLETEARSFLHRHWFSTAHTVLERVHGDRAHSVLQVRLYPAFSAWREATPFTFGDRDELARLGATLAEIAAADRDLWLLGS